MTNKATKQLNDNRQRHTSYHLIEQKEDLYLRQAEFQRLESTNQHSRFDYINREVL